MDDSPTPQCQVCGGPLGASRVVECAKCGTPHHRDCFQWNTSCATYACGETRFVEHAAPRTVLPQTRQARPPAGEPPRTRVLVDVESGLERSCRALMLAGLAVAALAPLFGTRPGPILHDEWFWIGLTLALVARCARVCVDDVLVADPATRMIWFERTMLGQRGRWPLYRAEDITGIGIDQQVVPFGDGLGKGSYRRGRLALTLQDGTAVPLGDFHGTADEDPLPDLRRVRDRIAGALGVEARERENVMVDLQPAPADGTARSAAWCFGALVAARWALELSNARALPLPAAFVGLLAGLAISHWWFLVRPVGRSRGRKEAARRALIAAYATKPEETFQEVRTSAVWLVIFGFPLTVYAANWAFEQARVLLVFRPTPCHITAARLETRRSKKDTDHRIRATFTWTVDGETYTSEEIAFNPSVVTYSRPQDADGYLRMLRPGTVVTGRYDPRHPQVAYVVTRPSPWLPVLLIVGVGLLYRGIAFFARWWAIRT